MNQFTRILEGIGSAVLLFGRSVAYLPTLPRQFGRFIEQCYLIGYTTLPIVAILSFFIGSVLALQAGYSMENFGGKQFIGSLVGLSMARELGPMMAAILLAGRVGSAIAAELASMKVYQEIDALITMNIPPPRMLVMPRLAAVFFMMPVLAIIANLVGWFGGAIICSVTDSIAIDPASYFSTMRVFLKFKDVVNGLNTRGGPREIGAAVTRAVVVSLILILVLDYFVTKLLTLM